MAILKKHSWPKYLIGVFLIGGLIFLAKPFYNELLKKGDANPTPINPFRAPREVYLNTLNSVDEAAWSELIKNPEVGPFLVNKTSGCSQNSPRKAMYFLTEDYVKNLKSGRSQFYYTIASNQCYLLGSIIDLVAFSGLPDVKYLTWHGKLKVIGLLTYKYSKIPPTVLKALGIVKKDLNALFLDDIQKPDDEFTFIRLGAHTDTPAPTDRPPENYYRFRVIDSARIKLMLAGKALSRNHSNADNYLILDVRSEEEAKAMPLAKSTNIPYKLSTKKFGSDTNFSWEIMGSDLDKTEYDISPLNDDIKNRVPIIVVGSGPTDGRPVWALRSLLLVYAANVFWYYDGAADLKSALQK